MKLYRPEAVRVVFFLTEDLGRGEVGKGVRSLSEMTLGEDYILEGSGLFVILRKPIASGDGEDQSLEEGWRKVSLKDIDETFSKVKTDGDRKRKELKEQLSGFVHIGDVSLLVCGNRGGYWTESQLELDSPFAEGKGQSLTEMSSVLKLDVLNRTLFHSKTIMTCQFDMFSHPVEMFAFRTEGTKKIGGRSFLPGNILLSYEVGSEEASVSEGGFSLEASLGSDGTPDSEGEASYRADIGDLVKLASRYVGHHLSFQHLYRESYKEYQKEVAGIRRDIQYLQRNINRILMGDEGRKRKRGEIPLSEDDIIYRSSVYSSDLTEINEDVSTYVLFLNDLNRTIERMEGEMGFGGGLEVPGLRDATVSLSDEMQEGRRTTLMSFEKLSRDVLSLQNRLKNSVDVFNTYRESSRRSSQKRMANTLNIIFAALAVIELSDFIGGLVIFGLDKNNWASALRLFGIACAFLLLIAFFIYIFVLRKIWSEG